MNRRDALGTMSMGGASLLAGVSPLQAQPAAGVALKAAPRSHRDGSRSLYFHAPDGTLVQIIYHRPLSQ